MRVGIVRLCLLWCGMAGPASLAVGQSFNIDLDFYGQVARL
jgi:hypothetical protein